MRVIETSDLTKQYGANFAVDRLNLEVEDGQIFGFLGPNGAGKSTTIEMILGLLTPTSGTASVLGHNPNTERRSLMEKIGYMPERPMYPPYLNPIQLLEFYSSLYSQEVSLDRIDELLQMVEIYRVRDQKIEGFSKGMVQRLSIAQALLCRPELLILDEPMGGLDPEGVKKIRSLISEMPDHGTTVFLSSHILSEVEKVSDHVGVIKNGKLAAIGSTAKLIDEDTSLEDLYMKAVGEEE